MADAKVAAEAKRLSKMSHQAFYEAWLAHVQGDAEAVRAAAFCSPEVAGRSLLAADRAGRELKAALPRLEGESKREYQARMNVFRKQLQAARGPVVATIEALADDEAEYLAQLDDEAFAEEWLSFVQQAAGASVRAGHNYVQGLAFRSTGVAARTQALSLRMMRDTTTFLPAAEGESRKAHGARISQLRSRLEAELRFLQYALDFSQARWGRMPTAPNHRLQALNLLAEKYPEEFSQLRNAVREDAGKARDEVRRQKRYERRSQARPAT
ncbi:hypothetical protein [Streptomyces sp. BH055]|uniref:hypothetical protein n=1 Tax=unclassified Streptomyces TaxID=2593676 RepID=UPI003BB4F2BE